MKSGIRNFAARRKLSVFLRTAIVASFAVAGLTGIAGTGLAHAQDGDTSFCYDGSTTVYCLDDWADGGQGNQVALDALENTNEEFTEEQITGRCNGGMVEDNCPFANPAFDQRYLGWDIVQLRYEGGFGNGYCLATGNGSGGVGSRGVIGSCNVVQTGVGGSNGSIFVDHNGYMINLYWSNKAQYGNNAACMESVLPGGQDGAGSYVNLDLDTVDGCTLWNSQLYD